MNAYNQLTTAERRTVDMTILGAAFSTPDGAPDDLHALRHAHAAVDTAVAEGFLPAARGELFKTAMTDQVADLFVTLLDAERR